MSSLVRKIQKRILAQKGVANIPVVNRFTGKSVGFAVPQYPGQLLRAQDGEKL